LLCISARPQVRFQEKTTTGFGHLSCAMGNSNLAKRPAKDYTFSRTIEEHVWSIADFHIRNSQMLCRISFYARVHYSTQRWFMTSKSILATNKAYPVATYLANFLEDTDKMMVDLAMNSNFRELIVRHFYGRLRSDEYDVPFSPTLPFPDYFFPFWDWLYKTVGNYLLHYMCTIDFDQRERRGVMDYLVGGNFTLDGKKKLSRDFVYFPQDGLFMNGLTVETWQPYVPAALLPQHRYIQEDYNMFVRSYYDAHQKLPVIDKHYTRLTRDDITLLRRRGELTKLIATTADVKTTEELVDRLAPLLRKNDMTDM
jgi:hypothetical protein